MRLCHSALSGFFSIFIATSSFACDVDVGGAAADVTSASSVIFWGAPIEAHLLGETEQRPASPRLVDFNGKAVFKVETAVKGVAQADLVSAYFSANGTSCDLLVSVGRGQFYFLRQDKGEFYWGLYTQPDWYPDCKEYLDLFESEFNVEFPLLRERLSACGAMQD